MNDFFKVYLEYGGEWVPRLWDAAGLTVVLSLLGFLLALLGGALLTAALRCRHVWLVRPAHFFVQVVRTVPLLALPALWNTGYCVGIGLTRQLYAMSRTGYVPL